MIAKLALAGVLAAGAVLTAAPAQADDSSYLDRLNAHGMVITDAQVMLNQGHAVCEALNEVNGAVVIAYLQRRPGYTYNEAYALVESAVYELCPWQDHTGDAQRQAA